MSEPIDWSNQSLNSTDWTASTLNPTLWTPEDTDPSLGSLLLQGGSTSLALESGDTFLLELQ